jgi:hypothetical protein
LLKNYCNCNCLQFVTWLIIYKAEIIFESHVFFLTFDLLLLQGDRCRVLWLTICTKPQTCNHRWTHNCMASHKTRHRPPGNNKSNRILNHILIKKQNKKHYALQYLIYIDFLWFDKQVWCYWILIIVLTRTFN